jgi:glycosyltransferase involved in cell wall biosynthesis
MSDREAPFITIIITTFNRSQLVQRAIDSVIAQHYVPLEIVVVDDGSTDGTAETLRSMAIPGLRLIRRDMNGGVTVAKNMGLDAVRPHTRFVGILDSDDELAPSALRALTRAAMEHPSASQLLGWCVERHDDTPQGQFPERDGPVTYGDALSGRFAGEFWHLAAFELLSDLRFEPRACGAEGVLWKLLFRRAPGRLIDRTVLMKDTSGLDRVTLESFDRATARGKMWVSLAELDAVGDDLRRRYPLRYTSAHLEAAKWATIAGDYRQGWSSIWAAARVQRSARLFKIMMMMAVPSRHLRVFVTRLRRGMSNAQ